MWHRPTSQGDYANRPSLEELLCNLLEYCANILFFLAIKMTKQLTIPKRPINTWIARRFVQPQGQKVDYTLRPKMIRLGTTRLTDLASRTCWSPTTLPAMEDWGIWLRAIKQLTRKETTKLTTTPPIRKNTSMGKTKSTNKLSSHSFLD